MSKICPECQTEFDDNHAFCSNCGARLVEKPQPSSSLVDVGRASAISGGVNINQSKNVTSHDVHYHTVNERVKSESELLREKLNQYHEAVSNLSRNGVISSEARAQLEILKFHLGLDTAETMKIERSVKNEKRVQAKASNDTLSIIGKMALESAQKAIEKNDARADLNIRKLAPICKTTSNEQAHFHYDMLLAAFQPKDCVTLYESHTVDSYWLSFWASMAYRELGENGEAEAIITEMTELWPERPEINVLLNACIGILIDNDGNLDDCQEIIIEYLTQSTEEPSAELLTLFHAMLHLVGVVEENLPEYSFYYDHFLKAQPQIKRKISGQKQKEPSKQQEVVENVSSETSPVIPEISLGKSGNPQSVSETANSKIEPKKKSNVKPSKNTKNSDDAETLYAEACAASGCKRVMLLQKAADAGSPDAMYDLADCYYDGEGINKDVELAYKWMQESADLGNSKAQIALGAAYLLGIDFEQNYVLAEKYLLLAAEKGSSTAEACLSVLYYGMEDYSKSLIWARKGAQMEEPRAYFTLGEIYSNGCGVEQNHEEALKWYEKAAEAGDADAQNIVGNYYSNGEFIHQDSKKAFEYYQKSASQGQPYGMFNLGYVYLNGNGTEINIAMAITWLQKAADADVPEAQNQLGVIYANGEYVEQDLSKAFEFYTKAAEQGLPYGMYNLAFCYLVGQGTEKNFPKADEWMHKAADAGIEEAINILNAEDDTPSAPVEESSTINDLSQIDDNQVKEFKRLANDGNPEGMYNLGCCYLAGTVVKQNDNMAIMWFKRAAEAGNAEAAFMLGDRYDTAEGYSRNPKEASKWYRKAANLGNAQAKFMLGKMYLSGDGVVSNVQKANDLITEAANLGCQDAIDYINEGLLMPIKKNEYKSKPTENPPITIKELTVSNNADHKSIAVRCLLSFNSQPSTVNAKLDVSGGSGTYYPGRWFTITWRFAKGASNERSGTFVLNTKHLQLSSGTHNLNFKITLSNNKGKEIAQKSVTVRIKVTSHVFSKDDIEVL